MIDPSTQLAALIRAQFAAQLRTQFKGPQPGTPSKGAQASHAPQDSDKSSVGAGNREMQGEAADDAQVKHLVALRVRALSPDDPQRRRKAFRLFLEGVLMQEFGRERLGDKGFDQVIDSVLQRMEGDADLRTALEEAGDLLLADAAPSKGAS